MQRVGGVMLLLLGRSVGFGGSRRGGGCFKVGAPTTHPKTARSFPPIRNAAERESPRHVHIFFIEAYASDSECFHGTERVFFLHMTNSCLDSLHWKYMSVFFE